MVPTNIVNRTLAFTSLNVKKFRLECVLVTYVSCYQIIDQETLEAVEEIKSPVVFCIAAWFGKVRLIDNMEINIWKPYAQLLNIVQNCVPCQIGKDLSFLIFYSVAVQQSCSDFTLIQTIYVVCFFFFFFWKKMKEKYIWPTINNLLRIHSQFQNFGIKALLLLLLLSPFEAYCIHVISFKFNVLTFNIPTKRNDKAKIQFCK